MPFNPNGLNREKFHHAFKIIEYKDSKNYSAKSIEDKIFAKHLLCSENDNDRDEWVEKIRFVIDNLKKNEGYESANASNIQLNMASIEKNSSYDLDSNNMTDEDEIISPREKKEIISETIESLNYNNNESENSTNVDSNNETKDENMVENGENIIEHNENNESIIENKENDDNEKINENKDNPENIIESKDKDESKDSTENIVENNQNEEIDEDSENSESVIGSTENIIGSTENIIGSTENIIGSTENIKGSSENVENITESKESINENKEEVSEINEVDETNENDKNAENNDTVENNETNENDETIGSPQNNNGWDSSDSDEENVDVIIDYDERNYLPEGFNFEEFEKQGLDINEYIRKNSAKSNENKDNLENTEEQNYDEEQEENSEEGENNNEEQGENEEEENYEEQKENNEVQESSDKQDNIINYEHKNDDIIEEKESCNESSYNKDGNKENNKSNVEEKPANKEPVRNAIIDDNERVMQQIIPPPLMPKTNALSQKQRLLKEEKQRKLHFSWYKFKKSSNGKIV